MPAGADTVVIQEHTRRGQTCLNLGFPEPRKPLYVTGFLPSWDTAAAAGNYPQRPEIAVLAAAQCTQIGLPTSPAWQFYPLAMNW